MKKKILFDFVIVNYNSTDYSIRCIKSIYEENICNIPVSINLIDNASCDGVDRVKNFFPQVNIVKNKYNTGFAKAVNKGLSINNTPYVVLLNPDTLVFKGFFETALKYLEENQEIGIIGPKILDSDGKIQGSARSFPNLLTAFFGRTSLLSKLFPNNSITRKNILTYKINYNEKTEVDWVSGACMIIRRKAVLDVGYLDENFFMYWEDADWCKRMWLKNWKVVYLPKICVMHHVGMSSKTRYLKSILEFHKSSYLLFDKYSGKNLISRPFAISGLIMRFFFVLIYNVIKKK